MAVEPKHDGFRGMVYLTRQRGTIYSKRGLFEARNVLGRAILDGEVVGLDNEGSVNWSRRCLALQT